MAILATLLSILGYASDASQSILTGGAANTDRIAGLLVKIAQAAANAFQQHTGAPMDPTLLKPIDKV